MLARQLKIAQIKYSSTTISNLPFYLPKLHFCPNILHSSSSSHPLKAHHARSIFKRQLQFNAHITHTELNNMMQLARNVPSIGLVIIGQWIEMAFTPRACDNVGINGGGAGD